MDDWLELVAQIGGLNHGPAAPHTLPRPVPVVGRAAGYNQGHVRQAKCETLTTSSTPCQFGAAHASNRDPVGIDRTLWMVTSRDEACTGESGLRTIGV